MNMKRWMSRTGLLTALVVAWGLSSTAMGQEQTKQADALKPLGKPAETSASAENAAKDIPAGETTESQSGPRLFIAEPTHDFGDVWVVPTLSYSFELKNSGTEVLKVLNVKPGCGCTVQGAYDREIPPGGIGKVPLTLRTRNLTNFTKSVTITTNDPTTPTTRVQLKGTMKYYVEAKPQTVRFPKIQANETVRQTVKITAVEDAKLELLDGGKAGQFQATLTKSDTPNEYDLVVEGTPPFQEGPTSGKIRIDTGVEKQKTLEIAVSAYVPKRLEIVPSQIYIPAGSKQNRPYRIRVTNNGDTPVEVLGATASNGELKATVQEVQKGKSYHVNLELPENYNPPAVGDKLVLKLLDGTEQDHVIPIMPPQQPAKPQPRPAMDLLGKPAPAVSLSIHDGKTIQVGQTNQITVMEFYTSWCGFCKRQMPDIQKAYETFKDNPNVRFVGISGDERTGKRGRTPEQVVETFKERGMTFDLVMDPDKAVGSKYKATSYPTLFVLGKTGKVESVHIGAKSNLNETLKEEISKLLEGKSLAADGGPKEEASPLKITPTKVTPGTPMTPAARKPGASG